MLLLCVSVSAHAPSSFPSSSSSIFAASTSSQDGSFTLLAVLASSCSPSAEVLEGVAREFGAAVSACDNTIGVSTASFRGWLGSPLLLRAAFLPSPPLSLDESRWWDGGGGRRDTAFRAGDVLCGEGSGRGESLPSAFAL